jgi:hypothetical protein
MLIKEAMEWKRAQVAPEVKTAEKIISVEKLEGYLSRDWSFLAKTSLDCFFTGPVDVKIEKARPGYTGLKLLLRTLTKRICLVNRQHFLC